MNDRLEILIVDNEANLVILTACLGALDIEFRLERGNGQVPRLLVIMDAEDDARLLGLWERLTDLRMRYIETRQFITVEQLSFLGGSEEIVIL